MPKHNSNDQQTLKSMEDYMGTAIDDVREPENLPSGDWHFRCNFATKKGNDEYDPADPNASLFTISFGLTPIEPVANVDLDLVESGAWRGKRHTHMVFVKGDADMWDARNIVKGFGITTDGRDFNDALELVKGKDVVATVGLRTFKRRDGTMGKANTFSKFRPAA